MELCNAVFPGVCVCDRITLFCWMSSVIYLGLEFAVEDAGVQFVALAEVSDHSPLKLACSPSSPVTLL